MAKQTHEEASSQAPKKTSGRMTLAIASAIVLAIALAVAFPSAASRLELGGEVFLRMLKMMVVPVVVTSVMSGILGLGDVRKLGRPGAAAVGYYLATTVMAVVTGLVLVNLVQPGIGTVGKEAIQQLGPAQDRERIRAEIAGHLAKETGLKPTEVTEVLPELAPEPGQRSISFVLKNLVLMLFTDNLFRSAVNMELLPLIIFSIVFAAMLTTMGRRVQGIVDLVQQADAALMGFVLLIMKVAPLGIFCLVTARFGEAQIEGKLLAELSQLGWYVSTVLAGLGIHGFVTLPIILWVCTRRNPYRFIYQMSQAILTAFSTASSSATLPITMECAELNARVSRKSAEFVLPLGATINMDGTALYEAVAAVFIAQVAAGQGVVPPLDFMQQVTIAVTATLAAIGAAGIPEAGLVTMLIVLTAVGLPLEYIGLILSIDWLLDRFRTAINVLGDAMGAAVVETAIPDGE